MFGRRGGRRRAIETGNRAAPAFLQLPDRLRLIWIKSFRSPAMRAGRTPAPKDAHSAKRAARRARETLKTCEAPEMANDPMGAPDADARGGDMERAYGSG